MAKCIICGETFYHQTETDPIECCLCGEMATGTLWQWDKHRAIIKYIRFIISIWLHKLANKIEVFH